MQKQVVPQDPQQALELARGLLKAFNWKDSTEGFTFWKDYYNTLMLAAGQEDEVL